MSEVLKKPIHLLFRDVTKCMNTIFLLHLMLTNLATLMRNINLSYSQTRVHKWIFNV